jgi:hypothetical protein
MFRYPHVAHAFLAQQGGHSLECGRLSMDHEGAANRSAQPAYPSSKLIAVCVGRVSGDGLYLGPSLVLLPQYADLLLPAFYSAAQGVLGLKSHEQDQVPVIADSVG